MRVRNNNILTNRFELVRLANNAGRRGEIITSPRISSSQLTNLYVSKIGMYLKSGGTRIHIIYNSIRVFDPLTLDFA